jgi:hypothetical protein
MFTRVIWTSEAAKAAWADTLVRASNLTSLLEVESVIRGHRPCSWQTVSEEDVPNSMMRWADAGLVGIPIKRVGRFEGFAHRHTPTESGRTGNVCIVVARTPKDALDFKEAFLKGDNVAQGELLGYPRCCGEFFEASWKAGFIDPIWQAAANTAAAEVNGNSIHVPSPAPFSNAMLRYAGLRLGFHIPHSFDCELSMKVNAERLALGRESDPALMDSVLSLLRMPMSWDCYHGIAIVRTPIFYIELGSIMAAERYVVEVGGDFLPAEGAKGTRFPFMQ